jgi:DNA-binding NtrC family response regulator
MNEPAVLVVHPDRAIAEEVVAVLQEYGFYALPITNAVDALEHTENVSFDVALVSSEMPVELAELLHHHSKGSWLEVMLLDNQAGREIAPFVLAVSEAAVHSREMAYHIAEAWLAAWHGTAGEELYSTNLTEAEWQAKFEELKRRLASRSKTDSTEETT